jgi:multidrug efflux pump subunit AcrA (membrane-fusion protein)
MKLNKKTFGLGILALLALFLFFSKTIYRYHLPEVTGVKPRRGTLSKLEISSGIAGWAETETVYAAAGGAAGRVFVKEGDEVREGDLLFEMDFDEAAAERKLAETGNNTGKLETDIRGLRSRLANIREALAAAAREEGAEAPALSGQAGLIALEIRKARIALANTRLTFELGASSGNDLAGAESGLQALFFKYEAEMEDLEHTLAVKELDLRNLRLAGEAAREVLGKYRAHRKVYAPAAGVVLALQAERGKYFPENAPLVTLSRGREFTVECTVSLDNNFVNPGDSCELVNSSRVLTGTVRRVKPSAQGKAVSIAVMAEELDDGETFEITFEETGAASFILVPNGAVNQDNDGYFLYQIKRRRGILGEEYYLERLDIFTGDSDHENTAVIRGITFFDPVALASDKALSPGITVALKNPGDFFEN